MKITFRLLVVILMGFTFFSMTSPGAAQDETVPPLDYIYFFGGLGAYPDQLTSASGMAFGSDGTLFVAEAGNGRIQGFNAYGES